MSEYHEPVADLTGDARDLHRALASLKEEIEAIDWYHQRVVTSGDQELAAVMAHNRDEEMEHAAMTLEWLRRKMPNWDRVLRTYLFTEGPIVEIEAEAEALATGASGGMPPDARGLGIGRRGVERVR